MTYTPSFHPSQQNSTSFVFQLELKNNIIKIIEKNQRQQQQILTKKENERISNITLHKPHIVKGDTNTTKYCLFLLFDIDVTEWCTCVSLNSNHATLSGPII